MSRAALLFTRAAIAFAAVALALASACEKPAQLEPYRPPTEEKNYARPLPPGQLALRKIPPEQYPDFSKGFYNRAGLEEAIHHSIGYLEKPSSKRYYPYGDITHERALASLRAFLQVLQTAATPEEFDRAIRQDFDVYQSVGWDDRGTVFFTGYYTPIFDGRKQRDGRFRFPLYKAPPDLVKDEEGRILGRRTPNGQLVKYYSRREIEEQGLCEGLEIAWLADRFEAYVVTVQGSAKLRLEDGTLYELGYAGNNGHDYTPVSKKMIDDGVIGRDELSLQALIAYFKAHPEHFEKYCWENRRFVFFREAPGGPFGSINVPVTPYRSIATDKQVFPRACLAFVDTVAPMIYNGKLEQLTFRSFALDQDTGGAIRAAGRCDIFMGIGPQAEAVAGRTGREGKLFYIFVKPGAAPSLARTGG